MLLQTTHLLQSIGNVAIYTVIGLVLFGLAFFIMGKATPFSLRKEIEEGINEKENKSTTTPSAPAQQ